jgi:hypothetical protein
MRRACNTVEHHPTEVNPMRVRRVSAVFLSLALFLTLAGRVHAAAPKTEIRGAAILDHPCGKVAVKHMGLVHAGKMDDATKLGTKEMQEQWKALPAADRNMMLEMMKGMSETEAQFSAEIKAGGLLAVEGSQATLTVKQEHKDANGSSSQTFTQNFVVDGTGCLIRH